MENNGYEEREELRFKYKMEDGTVASIPRVGKVNCIRLPQEDRVDYLFTRLPMELALKYTTGIVETKYGEAKGDRCFIATKYRGDIIDPDEPSKSGEGYTLLFTPFYAEKNIDLEFVEEGISDEDIRHSLIAHHDSKGLEYRNRWLREKELREKEREYFEGKEYDFRAAVTRAATKVVDDIDIGEDEVRKGISLYDVGKVTKWIKQNPILALFGFGFLAWFLWTIFAGGG